MFEGVDFVAKRAFDLVGAVLLVLVLVAAARSPSPLMVRLTSRGPVIYRSMRPGLGGDLFPCFKFRTMEQDAEHRQGELEDRNELGGRDLQDPRRPARHPHRPAAAPLLARRAARSCST